MKSLFSSAITALPDANKGESKSSSSPESSRYLKLSMFDVWVIALATVINGPTLGWNAGVTVGFGAFAMMQLITLIGYIILACSLGEMVGTTLFSGGSYGMARVTMGFYGGFMVGAIEMLEHIVLTAASLQFMGEHMCEKLGIDIVYFPLICLIDCLSQYFVIRAGHNAYWWLLRVLVVFSVCATLLYIFGGAQYADFSRYASYHHDKENESAPSNWFVGGVIATLGVFPITTNALTGIESTILITDMLSHPRRQISYGLISAIVTSSLCLIGVMFVACSLPPTISEFSTTKYLTDTGYAMILSINTIDTRWLLFPAHLALSMGLLLPSGKLYYALSDSLLLPPWLSIHIPDDHDPHAHDSSSNTPVPPINGNAIVPLASSSPQDHGKDSTTTTAEDKKYIALESGKSNDPQQKVHELSSVETVTVSKTEMTIQARSQENSASASPITDKHLQGIRYVLFLSYGLALIGEYTYFDLNMFVAALACLVYLGDLYSYIQLRWNYQTSAAAASDNNRNSSSSSSSAPKDEMLRSPFGVPGAIVAGLIFLMCEICVLFLEPTYLYLVQLVGFLVGFTVYYFVYAKSRQRFSRTEEKTLLALHVITNNRNAQKKRRGNNQQKQQQQKARMLAQKQQELAKQRQQSSPVTQNV